MPYRKTGRPNGRPPKYPVACTIVQLEARAESLRAQARKRQDAADQKIALELARGKSRSQLAAELGCTVSHVRYAVERHSKRVNQA